MQPSDTGTNPEQRADAPRVPGSTNASLPVSLLPYLAPNGLQPMLHLKNFKKLLE